MWLPDKSAHQIDRALKNKKFRQVDHLLEKIFEKGSISKEAGNTCPVCSKKLIHKALPYLEMVVDACPEDHGAWMNAKTCGELCEFITQQLAKNSRKRAVLLGLLMACSSLAALDIIAGNPFKSYLHSAAGTINEAKIGAGYWPMRDTRDYSLPLKQTTIDNMEDLYYLKILTDHLDVILSNRLNMEAVLGTRRSNEEYRDIYAFYAEKQMMAAETLEQMEPPEKFAGIHGKILRAVVLQIGFYADYTEEKMRRPETTTEHLMSHDSLQNSSRLLREAWDELQSLFPSMDEKTRLSLESRLCWTDII